MSLPQSTSFHLNPEFWEAIQILKENSKQYLIQWAGVDPKTNKPWPNSWVAKGDCTKDLVSEWKDKQFKSGRTSIENSKEYSVKLRPSNKLVPYILVPRIPKRQYMIDNAEKPANINTPDNKSKARELAEDPLQTQECPKDERFESPEV